MPPWTDLNPSMSRKRVSPTTDLHPTTPPPLTGAHPDPTSTTIHRSSDDLPMANISNQPQPQWMTTLAPTRGVPTLREMMVTRATEIPPKEVPGATVIPPPARPRSLAPEASELPRPDPAWAQPRPVATTGPPPEGRAEWRQQMRQTLFPSAPPLDWATLEYRLTEAKEDEARQVENHLLEVRGAHFWALREARRSRLQAKRTMTAEEVWQQAVRPIGPN
jgi:hypothetical protein